MSDYKFDCPHCSQSLEAPDDMAGEVIDCPTCGKSLEIPGPPASTPRLKLKDSGHTRSSAPPPPAQTACRYCGATAPAEAVFCVSCGRNMKTGQQLRTQTSSTSSWQSSPPRRTQSSHSGWIVLLVLLVAGFFGYQVYKDKTGAPRSSQGGGSASASRAEAQPEKPSVPQEFPMQFNVAVCTMGGNQWPRHSVTFELYVNGNRVRNQDSSSISAKFPSVTVKEGDRVSARALWRNGYGAVARTDESYDQSITVDKSCRAVPKRWIHVYEHEFMSRDPERFTKWH